MSDVLHSYAPLSLIPPAPFSHTGRRGSLGVLMPETGDVTQGLAKKSTPVSPRVAVEGETLALPGRARCPRAQHAGETPALPGNAVTRTVPARQEHGL
jgi:hypothetical protein